MVLLSGVEIFSAGTQTDSSGFTDQFTVDDIDIIVERFNQGSPEYVPVKLGHTSDEFNQLVARSLDVPSAVLHGENGGSDGVISLGRVISLQRRQNKLVADFDVPAQMKDLVDRHMLRDVSVEMVGKSGDWTLTAVAWLGAELPAVKDLNGLAAAATLRQQIAGPVLAFAQQVGFTTNKENRMSLKDKLAAIFKDSDDDELKALFAEEDEEDEDVEMEDDAVTVSPIGGEVAAAIRAMAGCDINCSDEELLDALRSLVGLPTAAPDELVPVMKARMEAKPVKFSETAEYKAMRKEIDSLNRKDRVSFYRNETRGLLIQGKDEDLAEKLVSIEEKSGEEVASEVLASWKRESESNRRYTEVAGRNPVQQPDVEDDFEDKVKAYMSENKLTRQQALARIAFDPAMSDEFNKWRASQGATEA